ncbi:MAG: hypothetical protein KAS32_13230 [Candidatus Peribacteraceae bacterium]|nr:hypothetical protein [Candidatus Peribacteraceae bacterium]
MNWTLSGWKTIVGTIALISVVILEEVAVGIWGLTTPWLPNLIATLKWVGTFFGSAGLLHKTIKSTR